MSPKKLQHDFPKMSAGGSKAVWNGNTKHFGTLLDHCGTTLPNTLEDHGGPYHTIGNLPNNVKRRKIVSRSLKSSTFLATLT